jgi:hypothetical protein
MPHWNIKLASGVKDSSASWIAKGDEDMESVCVRWGGFEVGRIRCESRLKKHTVSILIILLILPHSNIIPVYREHRTRDELCNHVCIGYCL